MASGGGGAAGEVRVFPHHTGPTSSVTSDAYVDHIGVATRQGAEAAIGAGGSAEGDYIVRISDSPHTSTFGPNWGICVWHNDQPNHYRIEKHATSLGPGRYKFGIGKGLRFEFLAELLSHYSANMDGICCNLNDNVKSMHEIEIRRGEIDMESSLLGEGEFGEVRKGMWRKRNGTTVEVAVKVLKAGTSSAEQETFVKEGRRMVHFDHRHVVRLLGIVREGGFMLVTEFVRVGALRKALRSRNKAGDPMGLPTQLLFMKQIAEGMEYLEQNHVVHRDLAARNILMDSETEVKISDFGMSRNVEDYYTSSRTGVWPLKWYAPECIYESKFTSKGDVWSFGVCSWEILSHGKKPYAEFSHGHEVVAYAIEGRGRLACPAACPESVYAILLNCWQHDRGDRPSFRMLAEQLHAIDIGASAPDYEVPNAPPPRPPRTGGASGR